ncbi:PREDICTED: mitotic apparatus protein p62-like [Nicotiana attenuata]|uniref:mitotic apparatus protein p62-like n=1 Tax=Nicotiana attenuata TaxID=49451 RepID=UPI00090576ED|nr:PREDICTED: mitotic apparatus protein p62-like [Nicotiana attenuata]
MKQRNLNDHGKKRNGKIVIREPPMILQKEAIQEVPRKGKGIDTREPKVAHRDAADQQGANQDYITKNKKKRNRANKQEHIKEGEEARAQIQHGKQQEDDQCQHSQHEEGLKSNPEVTTNNRGQGRSSHDNEPVSNESSESSDDENENSEDNDYEDEEGSDESEEYASMDSEEEDSDDNANRLVEIFVGNATITHAVNNVINSGHLSPRTNMGQEKAREQPEEKGAYSLLKGLPRPKNPRSI